MTKHFIDFDNLSFEVLQDIIDCAIALKKQHNEGVINNSLKNKTLAMIFDKSSTRTRVSFEAGMAQLGGHALFLSNNDIQLGRGEPITDSAIVISSMVDAVILRISSHEDIIEFSKHSNKPVINALSDLSHPCQILADLMTFQEHRGSINGKKVAWIGDGNNVCQTYMQAAEIFGFELNIACPNGYEPNQSMMSVANSDALFMHCRPGHRGEEVSKDVIDGKQSVVWHEAENRLHAQKALLLHLIKA